MANKVEIQIIGNNVMAVNAIDGVKTKLGTLEKSSRTTADRMLGHFKMIGGAFLAGGALSFMNSAIDAYKQQEMAVKKLDTALGKNSLGLQDFASQLQKVTTFSDELTIEAMSLIAAFTTEEEKIKGLLKASQDLAAAKNIDLLSATNVVTKAFASESHTIGKLGMSIEGAAGSTEKYNSIIKALSVYMGQAEAQGKTLAGQMEITSNQLNEQQEDIGSALLPVWLELNKAFATGISLLQDMSGYTFGKQLADQEKRLNVLVGERTDQMYDMLGINKSIVLGTFEKVKAEEKVTEENKKQVDYQHELNKYMKHVTTRGYEDAGGGGKALEPMMQFYDVQKQMIAEVTDYELAALFLRSEAAYQTFGDMAGAMMNFYQMAGEGSRTFFDMYKAFAAGEAAIAAWSAATKVFDATAFMFPFNYVAAGAALAFGLSNVARILSMQPGGNGGGGGGGSAPSVPRGGNTVNNNQRNANYNITINTQGGFQGDPDKFAREIIWYIDKARGDGG